uniref:Uncharacterized protein n=1 Tax=Candidatus Kentrum sp. FW TaxID=2126338 RepID=A0A450T0L1_9GAMM|nr:MAG: hypothetical protein BECKFW1821B_GA0114236_105310 [Candidatus Kentron sp. FW]
MPYQNIDATLSPADIKAIKAAVDTIEQKLPFLVNLTPKERKALFKAGPDSVSFLQNALDAARDHPNIPPHLPSTPPRSNATWNSSPP